jgi:solute carrier family 35 protein E1
VSLGKWLCLIPVIGGVVLASVKELDFAWCRAAAAETQHKLHEIIV